MCCAVCNYGYSVAGLQYYLVILLSMTHGFHLAEIGQHSLMPTSDSVSIVVRHLSKTSTASSLQQTNVWPCHGHRRPLLYVIRREKDFLMCLSIQFESNIECVLLQRKSAERVKANFFFFSSLYPLN